MDDISVIRGVGTLHQTGTPWRAALRHFVATVPGAQGKGALEEGPPLPHQGARGGKGPA